MNTVKPESILQQLPRPVRFISGVLGCGFVAFYVPLLFVTATGIWSNRLTMLPDVIAETTILAVISAVGLATKRVFLVTSFVAITFLLYLVQHYVRSPETFEIRLRWADFFHPLTALCLNAWLITRYKRSAQLSDQ